MKKIDKLIINTPYKEPEKYWAYIGHTKSFELKEGRRPASYVIADPKVEGEGQTKFIELVNTIRPRVNEWRRDGYKGITGITKRLLDHWYDENERQERRFFFCQLEAIETLIWLKEAPDSDKNGIDIKGDGGNFERICSKMATGTGKTIVMSMLIAWQILNKVTYPTDARFSKNILIVTPGLTVKSRLEVLIPSDRKNYYDEFNIIPSGLVEKLRQGNIKIINWHKLAWEDDEKIAKRKSVDKRGAMSDEAYTRNVLGDMANAKNILVLNDESHHAWRDAALSKTKGKSKEEEEARIWVKGLDRINSARKILTCFDFTATPFPPTGKKNQEESLFNWIVSDFGLNDAIESGLVKTPRIVIRDNSVNRDEQMRTKLFHIYNDETVKDDLNRNAKESEPLPQLVTNAYMLLCKDWLDTKEKWEQDKMQVPPCMITVANRTETASRVKNALMNNEVNFEDIYNDSNLLQIDNKTLEMAEEDEDIPKEEIKEVDGEETEQVPKLTKKEKAQELRKKVNTVGMPGETGEKIYNIISVGMLSEGWDAKNVTHIMGLRAFSSQLLCEQVVGRGLRRMSYEVEEDGLFAPEYVNIFGVPFTFLPHEDTGEGGGTPPKPKFLIEPEKDKSEFEIKFPNVIRIDYIYKPILKLDMDKVKTLELDPYENITEVQLSAMINGKPNLSMLTEIDLEELDKRYRLQTIAFESAGRIFKNENHNWSGTEEFLLAQLIRITNQFLQSDKIYIKNDLFRTEEKRKKIIMILNMNRIIQHIWNSIRSENTQSIKPIFDNDKPIKSTGDMRSWWTGKPCEAYTKTHINLAVFDSKFESTFAYLLDKNKDVKAWVKNDHLGFEIIYNYQGVIRKYYPDCLITLKNGEHLILEIKGQDREIDKTKREYLDLWVKAVNQQGGFGKWHWAVSFHPGDIVKTIEEIMKEKK